MKQWLYVDSSIVCNAVKISCGLKHYEVIGLIEYLIQWSLKEKTQGFLNTKYIDSQLWCIGFSGDWKKFIDALVESEILYVIDNGYAFRNFDLLAYRTKNSISLPIPHRTRFNVFKRDGFVCTYCGATAPKAKLVVDHVIPKSKGGSDDESNLTTACEPCNLGKSDKCLDQES